MSFEDEFLTDGQLCELLKIDKRTSKRWRLDDGGPRYVRVGKRRILYRRQDVESWIASRTFSHLAEEAA